MYEEVVRTIDAVFPLEPADQRGSHPAERLGYRDGAGTVRGEDLAAAIEAEVGSRSAA